MIHYRDLSENVYVLVGHGCDKQLEPPEIGPQIMDVPPNTSYIHLTECGRGSRHGTFYKYLKIHGDMIEQKYVHNSNVRKKDFINSRFTTIAYSDYNALRDIIVISKSGMYTLDYINNNINMFVDEDYDPISYAVTNREDLEYKSLFDIYSMSYEGSIYPTKEQVLTIYKRILFNHMGATVPQTRNDDLVYLIEQSLTRKEIISICRLTNHTIIQEYIIEVIDLMRRFPDSTWVQTACRNPCRTQAQIASGANPNDEIGDVDDTDLGRSYILRRKHSDLGSLDLGSFDLGRRKKKNKTKKRKMKLYS